MEKELKKENGEEQLSELIKEAGDTARMRREKALNEHFKKLKKVIADAAHQQISMPT
jgi:hypothetical protein